MSTYQQLTVCVLLPHGASMENLINTALGTYISLSQQQVPLLTIEHLSSPKRQKSESQLQIPVLPLKGYGELST